MRILLVQLDNWRNFQSVKVELQQRVFLTGPNASGKSNLLDAFRFLKEIATPGSGGLQRAVERRQGLSKIRCLSARRYPDVSITVTLGDRDAASSWLYRLSIHQDNLRRPIVRSEHIEQNGTVILQRPEADDNRDRERLTQTHLEQVNANRSFREVVDFLSSIRYLHVVPQLIREPERSVGRVNDPYGGDFLEQLARTQKKTLESRLRRITAALQIAVPQLQELRLERDQKGTPHLSGLYRHWRQNAGWQSEDQFSDGTLRLLGLLWSVLDGTGPLLLEEPELSLNPEVVRHIPQMFARLVRRTGRQIVVSTHSRDLLEDIGIAPDETLMLQPTPDGTIVRTAKEDIEDADLLASGFNMAEVVLPRISPQNTDQLSLFGDR